MTDNDQDQRNSDPPPRESLTCSEINFEAVTSAFALIACADANLGEKEIERFRELLRNSEACSEFDLDALEASFLKMSKAMLEDFSAAKHRALEAIARVRDDETSSRLVIQAAQVALVADGVLNEVEEYMLAEICRTLGVDPEEH